MTTAPLHTIALVSGKDGFVPLHLKEAFTWAKDRGIFDFSEAELVHELGLSEKARVAKKVINSSIEYSEKMTRPPMFMAYADMFHKAGYRGEDAYQRAQAATDYSMTNYHPDERPALYSGLGEIGSLLSALSTYKHSFMEQTISTGVNAKREPAAAMVYLAIAASLYGVSGMPGYQDADRLVQGITKKSIREFLLDDPTKANKVMDGLASWYSGYDIQSRVSTSQILPDPAHPTSVAPHIQNILGVLGAALDAGVKHDTASFQELARKGLPASARNIYEDLALTDKQGWVENTRGMVNVEQPRTEEQRILRRGLGLRPLQEKLDSETLWTRQKAHVARQDKLKTTEKDIASSYLLKDGPGLERAIGRYLDAGGDPSKLQEKSYWENIGVQGNLTPSQRAAGINPQSWDSVQRSLDFRK